MRRGWLVVMSLWLASCGYRLGGSALPGTTISVPLFENRTIETGIESIVTEAVLAELRRAPGIRVVPPGEGRYVLHGRILGFDSDPHLVSPSTHMAEEHRARLILWVALRDRQTGKDLWIEPRLSAFTDYPLTSDILANERAKRVAIARIASELASRIRNRVQDTW
jgi:hypothetical protein